MTNPFKFRPSEGDLDWEDNWLSNSMAYGSKILMPAWCQTPEHWTSRFTNYFWAECPCCNALRGLTIGAMLGLIVGLAVGLAF